MPEEYREFISKMREYGYGIEKEKNLQEQIIEFIENSSAHNIPRGSIKDENKRKKRVDNMTPEEHFEINLYKRWNNSKEKEVLEKCSGKSIEEVPEEYRGFISKMREYGYGLEKKKKRTSKEIAEASISSLTDIEMSDREDAALKELVEKTKEGGINLDEQS